jgi:hypothetical protein
MDFNLPVFATGIRIFRASNDVGPLFLDHGSTLILEINMWTQRAYDEVHFVLDQHA